MISGDFKYLMTYISCIGFEKMHHLKVLKTFYCWFWYNFFSICNNVNWVFQKTKRGFKQRLIKGINLSEEKKQEASIWSRMI